MNSVDYSWLLLSVAKAWTKVRKDFQRGYIWNERDSITSFYRSLQGFLREKNGRPETKLGKLRLLTELTIHKDGDLRSLDLAIVQVDEKRGRVPEPIRIIAAFEFKFGLFEEQAKLEGRIRNDLRKLEQGNDEWCIWNCSDRSAKTPFVFFALVSDNWSAYERNGILHPNGYKRIADAKRSIPRLEDLPLWLKYHELHGPISNSQLPYGECISKKMPPWTLFRITRGGYRKAIASTKQY